MVFSVFIRRIIFVTSTGERLARIHLHMRYSKLFSTFFFFFFLLLTNFPYFSFFEDIFYYFYVPSDLSHFTLSVTTQIIDFIYLLDYHIPNISHQLSLADNAILQLIVLCYSVVLSVFTSTVITYIMTVPIRISCHYTCCLVLLSGLFICSNLLNSYYTKWQLLIESFNSDMQWNNVLIW